MLSNLRTFVRLVVDKVSALKQSSASLARAVMLTPNLLANIVANELYISAAIVRRKSHMKPH